MSERRERRERMREKLVWNKVLKLASEKTIQGTRNIHETDIIWQMMWCRSSLEGGREERRENSFEYNLFFLKIYSSHPLFFRSSVQRDEEKDSIEGVKQENQFHDDGEMREKRWEAAFLSLSLSSIKRDAHITCCSRSWHMHSFRLIPDSGTWSKRKQTKLKKRRRRRPGIPCLLLRRFNNWIPGSLSFKSIYRTRRRKRRADRLRFHCQVSRQNQKFKFLEVSERITVI